MRCWTPMPKLPATLIPASVSSFGKQSSWSQPCLLHADVRDPDHVGEIFCELQSGDEAPGIDVTTVESHRTPSVPPLPTRPFSYFKSDSRSQEGPTQGAREGKGHPGLTQGSVHSGILSPCPSQIAADPRNLHLGEGEPPNQRASRRLPLGGRGVSSGTHARAGSVESEQAVGMGTFPPTPAG